MEESDVAEVGTQIVYPKAVYMLVVSSHVQYATFFLVCCSSGVIVDLKSPSPLTNSSHLDELLF